MDFAFARGSAIVFSALVVVACSSSSSTSSVGGGESSGDGGRSSLSQDGSSAGSSSNADAAVDYDAAIAACAPYSSEVERQACCEQQVPRGYLALHVAEQDCVCGSSGPCLGVCNYQDCASLQASTTTCLSCLQTNLEGSCKATVASACASDPGCVAYRACVSGGTS